MDVPMKWLHAPIRAYHARRLSQVRRKKTQTSESYGTFEVQESPQLSEAHPLPSVSGVFLDLQEHTQRARYVDYGNQILDELEQLRKSLLLNQVSVQALEEMLTLLEAQSSLEKADPLACLLREIETRARVELAKLRQIAPTLAGFGQETHAEHVANES